MNGLNYLKFIFLFFKRFDLILINLNYKYYIIYLFIYLNYILTIVITGIYSLILSAINTYFF